MIRYRLLLCRACGARDWRTDDDPSPDPDRHEWWEEQTLFAESNGPGLVPTQVDAPAEARVGRQLGFLPHG